MNILDIDLDFFLDRTPIWESTDTDKRLNSGSFIPCNKKDVELFLSTQCGLRKDQRIPGKLLTHHDEVYYQVRNFIELGKTKIASIDHVDAHADLGLGDLCYKYLYFNLLLKPVKERYYHDDAVPNIQRMGPGNFLLFMITCRWILKIRYVHLDKNPEDLN
jgi:hypothetical protein